MEERVDDLQQVSEEIDEYVSTAYSEETEEVLEGVEEVLGDHGFDFDRVLENDVRPEVGPDGELSGPQSTTYDFDVESMPYGFRVRFEEGDQASVELYHEE